MFEPFGHCAQLAYRTAWCVGVFTPMCGEGGNGEMTRPLRVKPIFILGRKSRTAALSLAEPAETVCKLLSNGSLRSSVVVAWLLDAVSVPLRLIS